MTDIRYTASTITDDALDQLYVRLDTAEGAVKRAAQLASRWAVLRAYGGAAVELRKALAEQKESTTP
ncbi:hypothetical protein [Streptomyces thermoviolaceus]|uniref:hypothetical protein n=1 Tax=Streptomyces thermoviolaceus TaxID=1952 RepID=UPI001677FAEA|nr:hypothetical protein [Streptomyces thermoviolaceus]GGV80430.1 hypothetical protein GCM10010499_43340 [Streptomyces thermoviolaceus subsp. apingens]